MSIDQAHLELALELVENVQAVIPQLRRTLHLLKPPLQPLALGAWRDSSRGEITISQHGRG